MSILYVTIKEMIAVMCPADSAVTHKDFEIPRGHRNCGRCMAWGEVSVAYPCCQEGYSLKKDSIGFPRILDSPYNSKSVTVLLPSSMRDMEPRQI